MAQTLILPPEFDQHPDGLGVGHACPRISWRFDQKGDATLA